METRRKFIQKIITLLSTTAFWRSTSVKAQPVRKSTKEVRCALYRAINGSPEANMTKVIELMGGVEKIVESDDIVVIKPNVQWWNQGAPNISALKTFVDLIMDRPGGFRGEVVIAENCHRGLTPWKSKHSGWVPTFVRNSNIDQINNYSELSALLKRTYGEQFTTCHWINVGMGGQRVFSPADGTGYVYCDGTNGVPLIVFDNGQRGDQYRSVIMSYPIFMTDKGTIVDFKNGIWEKGGYTGQPLKFINFAALNHHSYYCGATSAIKNYLGISDLSGGPDPHNDGKLTEDYYNFHSFPFNNWAPGPEPGMLGAEIAEFMKTIRKADLNITTADWIGLISRTETPASNTKSILACADPVALDYHACKYLLYPNSQIGFHNPEDPDAPVHQYIKACADHGGGIFDESEVGVTSWDFKANRLQGDDKLVVSGECDWGSDIKTLSKYGLFRWLPFLVS